LENHAVGIKDQWIAYAGPNPADTIGPQTEIIDAAGKTVIPGLIDGHSHLAWFFSADEFLKYACRGGTTLLVTETLEPYPVVGYEGVVDFLESFKDQPIKILATAPPMVSISHTARGIPAAELQKLLARDDILGIGESYWQAVLQEPELLLPTLQQSLLAGKTLEGHSAGAGEKKLSAYVAAGISSCHEPIDEQQVLVRLRMGLHIMIREGSIRRELADIAKIKDRGIDTRRLILVTDGISPADLMEKGYMEYVVQKAIDCGFAPIEAIQMATLNVAEHFSIDGLTGGIAPGRYADLAIIPDVSTIETRVVISSGRVIAENGRLLAQPRKHEFSPASLNSIHLSQKLTPADFTIQAPGGARTARIRVIEQVTDLVTAELHLDVPVVDGRIDADVGQDLLKIAAVDRTNHPGRTFTGLIKGFGLKSGAMACSASWDTTDIVVVGANDADMATAVNRIHDLQGGAVVCNNGDLIAELPLPVFGLISDLPIEDLSQQLNEIINAVSKLGVIYANPLLTLITLTGASIPYLRICEEGLVNLKDGQNLGLFVD
jgi:adenine deaminase